MNAQENLAPRAHVRVGQFTPSIVMAVAEEEGLFRNRGLSVEGVPVPSSPEQFRMLADGHLDVILTSPDNVIAYRFLADNALGALLPVDILAALDGGLGLGLYSIGETSSGQRLRVGVDVANSGFAFAAYDLLERAGHPRGGYETVTLGSTPRRAAALVAGDCDITMLNAGNEMHAMRAGAKLIRSVSDDGPYIGSVIARLAPQDDDNDAATVFAEVMIDASDSLIDGNYVESALQHARRLLDLTASEAATFVDGLRFGPGGLIRNGEIDREAMLRVVDLRRRTLPREELEHVMSTVMPTHTPRS